MLEWQGPLIGASPSLPCDQILIADMYIFESTACQTALYYNAVFLSVPCNI